MKKWKIEYGYSNEEGVVDHEICEGQNKEDVLWNFCENFDDPEKGELEIVWVEEVA